jgi:hypothetical protein
MVTDLNAAPAYPDGGAAQPAQERNIEVGVLVRLPNFAKSLSEQFESLVNRGQLKRVPGI